MQIYWDNPSASLTIDPVTFLNISGVQTDPGSISLTIIDPLGNTNAFSGSGPAPGAVNEIVRVNTGNYSFVLSGSQITAPGLYTFVWVGSGNGVNQVTTGSVRAMPMDGINQPYGLTAQQSWYCSLGEFKSRNGILPTNTTDDYEITAAIQAASGWINRYCGTHFYSVIDTRTFPITNLYYLPIDQIVAIYTFKLDYDGDGIYETTWTEGTNFQLYREGETYNTNYAGIVRPFDYVKVTLGTPSSPTGGEFFPFVWPFTPNNRVQIEGNWGWASVPPEVNQACLIMATQLFREKDSPWGVAGVGDIGAIRTSQSPFLIELLRPYINPRKKVGI